jgi:hypothetical protein
MQTGSLEIQSSEGAWTPVLVSAGATFSYTQNTGRYTRISNLVFCQFIIQTSGVSGTTTAALYIEGLPFTAQAGADKISALSFAYTAGVVLVAATSSLLGEVAAGSKQVQLWESNFNAIVTAKANYVSASYITGSFVYLAA